MLQLYYAKGSIAVASAITLYEAGLSFEPISVDFSSGEQTKPAYHKVNPKGRVPALAGAHGILTETGAVLEHIADLAPQANLVPSDPWQRAKMREVMYYLGTTMHVNHAHKGRGSRWSDTTSSYADMAAKVSETMTASCDYIEATCALDPFALGADFCLADPYLYILCSWVVGDGVDLADFPRIAAYLEMMEQRPSVKSVRATGIL